MTDVISRGSCPPEACIPPATALRLLTREELEDLAARFYGRCPERFEELLLEIWAAR